MLFVLIVFFKQKTAYEMRISYWGSEVCSSDLGGEGRASGQGGRARPGGCDGRRRRRTIYRRRGDGDRAVGLPDLRVVFGHVHRQFDELQIERASCRERVCQYV